METIEIGVGDRVKHKNLLSYKADLMTVNDIEGNKILCEYFDSVSRTDKEETFDRDELEVVQKIEGGFYP